MKYKKLISYILFIFFLGTVVGCKQARIIESFDAPARGPLVYDGENFLLQGDDFLWKMDKKGELLGQSPEPFPRIRDMHFDGDFFWFSLRPDNESSLVYTVDLAMNIIDSFVIPDPCFLNGIVFDGTNIWITDNFAVLLKKLDTSGTVLNTVKLPFEIEYLTFDGEYLWGTRQGSNWGDFGSIIKMDVNGKIKSVLKVHFFPSGITFDGTDLWVSGQTLQNEKKLFRILAK